jgi:hypothetical protein
MPIYVMQCEHCDRQTEIYRTVAEMDRDLPTCHGSAMFRRIQCPMVIPDIQPYRSTLTGEEISSRSKHNDHMKAHGVHVKEPDSKRDLKPRDVTTDLKQDLIPIFQEKARFS